MRIQIARLVKYVTVLSLWGIVIAPTSPLRAEPDTNKTKQRLSRQLASLSRAIDEIKWSNVTIYRVQDELKQRLIQPQLAASARDSQEIEAHGSTILVTGEVLPNFYNTALRVGTAASVRRDVERFRERLADQYGVAIDDLDPQETEEVLSLVSKVISERANIPKEYFLITTRDKGDPLLIALIGIEEAPGGGFNLKGAPQAGIDLYDYLERLDQGLYTDMRSAVSEGRSLTNQMFVLRDLSEITLAPRTKARATYLDEDRYPHILLSVSQGRPLRQQDSNRLYNAQLFQDPTLPTGQAAAPNMVEYPYEITVGTDVLAAFRAFKVTNDTLPVPEPDWGVELLNHFDELNYPSIWGGRLTLNAILENIKIGAVLPQLRFGGNTIDSSGFGTSRQKIIGGYGIAVSGDFAAPVLDNSGLFNFYGSYTFDEQNTDRIRLFDSTFGAFNEVGYLIRYALQAYYSFGFYADAAAKHLFRLKIGATVYGVDSYTRHEDAEVIASEEPRPTLLIKGETESLGGVSGKLEYMKGGQAIPWGASVQYVDNSILADAWIQFAITPRFDLKFEGKYFTSLEDKAERLISHPWENPYLVVPAVSVKYHF